jgi:hypothetical protein
MQKRLVEGPPELRQAYVCRPCQLWVSLRLKTHPVK